MPASARTERSRTESSPSELARRERIVRAALSLFSRRGFRGTSVRMIAEQAGVSQGLLYNYYDGKDRLLDEIFERGLRDVGATFDEAEAVLASGDSATAGSAEVVDASAGPPQRDGAARGGSRTAGSEAIATLIRAALRTVRENQEFWRLSYQIRMQPEVMEGLRSSIRAWTELVRSRLEALLRAAAVPDAAVRARVLFAAIDGAAQHYVLDPDTYPLEQVADTLAELVAPTTGTPRSGGRT